MRSLTLNLPETASPDILCLGAHCDDIEIGCGGTLLQILSARPESKITWVVFCSDDVRRKESENAARSMLGGAADSRLEFLEFRDGYLPYDGARVKDELRSLRESMNPDIVFTHQRDDLHQDHRLVSEITWNLFRDHLILEYEIPKYDGDLGQPNAFFPLDDEIAGEKVRILLESFRSQANKHWFSDETFRSLLRLRGIESGRAQRYAEAFYCRKLCLKP